MNSIGLLWIRVVLSTLVQVLSLWVVTICVNWLPMNLISIASYTVWHLIELWVLQMPDTLNLILHHVVVARVLVV